MLISDSSCDRFIALVATHTGLNIHGRDVASFRTIIQQRVAQLKLSSADAYYQRLVAASASPSSYGLPLGDRDSSEWHHLLTQLTVGESYFFRDHKQFALIKSQLIPDLIQQRKTQPSSQPSTTLHLHLWSAGCATGEETYSLAIMMQELGLPLEQVTATVTGTDINPDFLAKARQGRYGEWSFRQTDGHLRQHHFQAHGSEQWQINPTIKSHTSFLEFNLVQDNPSQLTTLTKFDLILCRNVFIYFTPAAIARTLDTFYQALNPGGYLVTGHAELQGIPLHDFQVRCFPESIVYQRPMRSCQPVIEVTTLHQASYTSQSQKLTNDFYSLPATPQPSLGTTDHRAVASPTNQPMGDSTGKMLTLPSRSRMPTIPSDPTEQHLNLGHTPTLSPDPDRAGAFPNAAQAQQFAETLQRAQQYANLGRYDQARHACEAAIALQPFAVEPCYLLSSIAEETNDWDGAKVFLKRVIYLDEMAIAAYLELAALYDRTEETDRATKTRRSVVRILDKMPPQQTIPSCDNMTVAELKTAISHHIPNPDG